MKKINIKNSNNYKTSQSETDPLTLITYEGDAEKMLITEHEFTLPNGYIDNEGNLHRNGIMRLATAMDEIAPLQDPRAVKNPAYLTILILSRVITKLGALTHISTAVVENLFSKDLAYLNDMYQRLNGLESRNVQTICPHCENSFSVPINFTSGE